MKVALTNGQRRESTWQQTRGQGHYGEATHWGSPHNKAMVTSFVPLKRLQNAK